MLDAAPPGNGEAVRSFAMAAQRFVVCRTAMAGQRCELDGDAKAKCRDLLCRNATAGFVTAMQWRNGAYCCVATVRHRAAMFCFATVLHFTARQRQSGTKLGDVKAMLVFSQRRAAKAQPSDVIFCDGGA